MERRIIFSIVACALVVVGCSSRDLSPEEKAARDARMAETRVMMDALNDCQMAIKQVSRDSTKVSIPYAEPMASGDEYIFSWPRGKLRMPNGLGIVMPASASCSFDKTNGGISYLSINGKTVIQ